MKSSEILYWLKYHVQQSSDVIICNYYLGGWECDLLKVTKADIMTEYEVKVSRADFFKDFDKHWMTYDFSKSDYRNNAIKNTKHNKIMSGDRVNKFFFVVPEGLVKPDEVPKGLGLIYAKEMGHFIRFETIKMPKMLSKEIKVSQFMYRHIAQMLMYRLANAKQQYKSYKAKGRI